MKKICYQFLILFVAIGFSGCSQQTEICDCFKIRLEIKKLIKTSEDSSILAETEKYKILKIKKKECQLKIEPAYFEEKQIKRNGRNDKEFLLEELGDCEAVKELLSEHQ